MITLITLMFICVFIITVLVIYSPLMYIRKTDKILKLLEKIEANTRKT